MNIVLMNRIVSFAHFAPQPIFAISLFSLFHSVENEISENRNRTSTTYNRLVGYFESIDTKSVSQHFISRDSDCGLLKLSVFLALLPRPYLIQSLVTVRRFDELEKCTAQRLGL